MRDTQREAETQAEGEAGSPRGAWCKTRFQDPRIMTWAEGRCSTAKSPRCPGTELFLFHFLMGTHSTNMPSLVYWLRRIERKVNYGLFHCPFFYYVITFSRNDHLTQGSITLVREDLLSLFGPSCPWECHGLLSAFQANSVSKEKGSSEACRHPSFLVTDTTHLLCTCIQGRCLDIHYGSTKIPCSGSGSAVNTICPQGGKEWQIHKKHLSAHVRTPLPPTPDCT